MTCKVVNSIGKPVVKSIKCCEMQNEKFYIVEEEDGVIKVGDILYVRSNKLGYDRFTKDGSVGFAYGLEGKTFLVREVNVEINVTGYSN